MSNNKYNASGVWHDLETDEELLDKPTRHRKKKYRNKLVYFQSQHEYEVYLALREYFPKEAISIHQPVLIKPETANFKAITWSVDFFVRNKGNDFLVEAKGYSTREFLLKLALFEYYDKQWFDRLILVFPDEKYQGWKLTNKCPELKSRTTSIKGFRSKLKNKQIPASILHV